MKIKKELLKFIIILLYLIINTFLIKNNLNCLPIEVLTKILENMNNNPMKSGLIMQILYFCMVAYYEYPYDYSNHQNQDPLIADDNFIEIKKLQDQINETNKNN